MPDVVMLDDLALISSGPIINGRFTNPPNEVRYLMKIFVSVRVVTKEGSGNESLRHINSFKQSDCETIV
jgi:hypothetical protein